MSTFAKHIKESISELRPAWRFVRVARINGVNVFFELPAAPRRFRQLVVFHEIHLHRKTLVPTLSPYLRTEFLGREHVALMETQFVPERDIKDAAALHGTLTRLLPKLERLAATSARRHARDAARLAKLFDRLDAHFKRWDRAEGRTLPDRDLDPQRVAEPAFKKFMAYLKREGLMVPSAKLTLWHWWRDEQPWRRSRRR